MLEQKYDEVRLRRPLRRRGTWNASLTGAFTSSERVVPLFPRDNGDTCACSRFLSELLQPTGGIATSDGTTLRLL